MNYQFSFRRSWVVARLVKGKGKREKKGGSFKPLLSLKTPERVL